MLQELGFMHKIIVNDTYNTLLHEHKKARMKGIFNALRAIAKLLESQIRVMGSIPEAVLGDANTLYGFATKSDLLSAEFNDGPQGNQRDMDYSRGLHLHSVTDTVSPQ